MKHFSKGAAVVAGVMIVLMIINMIISTVCSRSGIELNSTVIDMSLTFIGVFSGICIYDRWTRDGK